MTAKILIKRILLITVSTILFSTVLTFSITAWSIPKVPDEEQTPGSVCNTDNNDFTEYRYPENIPYCTRNVSAATKTKIYQKYNIPEKCRSRYTIDHLIPLSVGGDNSELNLWPEHKLIKAQRPKLEIELYAAIRDGEITQQEAVEYILIEKTTFKGKIKSNSNCDIGY